MGEVQKLPVVYTGEPGRPAFSDAVRKKIIANLKVGCTRKDAYLSVGVGESTFFRWIQENEGFREQVIEAEAYAAALYTRRLAVKAGQGDTKAITFWLERRRPEEWRERSTLQVVPMQEVEAEEALGGDDVHHQRLVDLAEEAQRRAATGTDGSADPARSDEAGPD